MYKIGLGYDIHRLVKGRKLFLGGVKIPFTKGLLGHSDADVLLHAVCDALLGAVGERDIGYHFPTTDDTYQGISSLELLSQTLRIIKKHKYHPSNIDIVVLAEAPKIGKYVEQIKKNIAGVLKMRKNCIGIKATTNEGVGFIGKGQAIAALAIVSLNRK
ncbi:MAG: 2-C-methyl-D-erythritol 2,4-cyclodiphosphate synthase [bacterium]|nr:2-C-methyl-D-erythritol 2,4-cyclodiphosphate synthase [bacterium]MDD5756546.1 2-C-methyl-D-erythritol 2,4-cyclodiphosphate synthase [bacterium]